MAVRIQQKPLAEIASSVSAKTPIGSMLRSREWSEIVPRQLREEAFFSATVESVRALAAAQRGLNQILTMARDDKGALAMDRSKWIAELQTLANRLGLRNPDESKRGGLQDFGSERRLALIYEQQISAARNKAYYLSGQDPDILDAWPAQELIRIRDAVQPRDWQRRWVDAGGELYAGGRMIALKTDPIWVAISRFGRPYPPFDYNSGMGLEEIDREEAEALGLIQPGERIEPVSHEDELARELKQADDPKWRAVMTAVFGQQIQFDKGKIRWKRTGAKPPAPAHTPKHPQKSPTAVSRSALLSFEPPEMPRYIAVLDIIDSVHDDGNLRPVDFNHAVKRGSNGTYFPFAGAVTVKRNAQPGAGEVTLVHEIGHWLDHKGIPSNEIYASEDANSPLVRVMDAIYRSEAFKNLANILNRRHRNYARSGRECWARAYAQFIAEESGNPLMLQRIRTVANGTVSGYPLGIQWMEQDFAPIRQEIKTAFQKMGWMK